jgi:hypothetical protein
MQLCAPLCHYAPEIVIIAYSLLLRQNFALECEIMAEYVPKWLNWHVLSVCP